MTVTSTTNKNQYTGNGSLATYNYGFKVFTTSDISVYVADVLQTLGSGASEYQVTGAGSDSGGTVVFGTAPANGANVTLLRSIPYTQVADYTAYDPFSAETHETALDKSVIQAQQLLEKHDRTFKMKPSFTGTEVLVDNPSAGKALKWNAAATGIENSASDIDSIVASVTASQTATATSATAAATSATAAAASATSAATSYDNFDDRFLGPKASAPSTDNDSNALLDGCLYFDTTLNVMFVYDLGNTTWVRTTPTASDQTKINTVSGIASDVSAVAGKATEIGLLGTASAVADMAILGTADVVADMNTLGTAAIVADMNIRGTADVVSDMNTLASADIVADMNTLATADIVADMNTLGTAEVVADMNTLATADVVADMNTLGTADVVNDMNVLGTAGNVTAMNTLGTAGNVTNMATLANIAANITTCATNEASINRYSSEYTIASSAPGSPSAGDLWYDSTSGVNQLKYYTGSAWTAIAPGLTQEVDPNAAALALALG